MSSEQSEAIVMAHRLNCGAAFEAGFSALHGAESGDSFYEGCDVSLSLTRQEWDAEALEMAPATTTYQLSVAEARELVEQLQDAIADAVREG